MHASRLLSLLGAAVGLAAACAGGGPALRRLAFAPGRAPPTAGEARLRRRAEAAAAEEAEVVGGDGKDERKPLVAVLGAGGKTGSLVVRALADAGARPRALTRSGGWVTAPGDVAVPASDMEVGKADVTDPASLAAALAGAVAVVFAAAFKPRGASKPKDVDYQGLVNTALAVRDSETAGRLVVVSSGCVTRPYAPTGVLLNLIGSGVLLEKLKGESEMRGILSGTGGEKTYTVIRPGGLRNDEAVGCESLEFNQGDTVLGSVPRADVAAVCAAAALDPANRGAGKTFEMYEARTRSPTLPWYGTSKYTVGGEQECGAMLGKLKDDADVAAPGILPF